MIWKYVACLTACNIFYALYILITVADLRVLIVVFILFLSRGIFCTTVPDIQFIFPTPGATLVSSEATIIVRYEQILPTDILNKATSIRVWDKNGIISGKINTASDKRTLIFKSDSPFKPGTVVHVSLEPEVYSNENLLKPVKFTFQTAKIEFKGPGSLLSEPENAYAQDLQKTATRNRPRIMPNGVSVPSDFPHINAVSYTH